MEELIKAITEAVRSIVQQEIATALKNYADTQPAEFAAVVSRGALDQLWFDQAIKSEVATAIDSNESRGLDADGVKALIHEVLNGKDYLVSSDLSDEVYDVVQGMEFRVSVR